MAEALNELRDTEKNRKNLKVFNKCTVKEVQKNLDYEYNMYMLYNNYGIRNNLLVK